MDKMPTRKISAIIRSEKRLEQVITKLIQQSVAHHDISVQGSPNKMADKIWHPLFRTSMTSNTVPIIS